jgi:hypothetical protein
MPFTRTDVEKHTSKATTDALKDQWVEVANSALEDCEGSTEECDKAAITQANGVIARRVEESAAPETVTVSISEMGTEASMKENVTEFISGQIVAFSEAADDDHPATVNFIPIKPGWGNRRDNHYYPLNTVVKAAEDAWLGAKMWATDHKGSEKNAGNQVTEVIESPAGFTDDGVPFVKAVILDPHFEEMVRRREASGTLHNLHCSIFANGEVRREPFSKNGRTGKYVELINRQDAGIDWVTRHGAGGHALAESDTDNKEGKSMSDEQLDKLKEQLGEADAATKKLEEQNKQLEATIAEMEAADAKRATEQRRADAKRLIEDAKLPKKTAASLTERYGGELEEADIERLKAELESLKTLAAEVVSPVSDMGGGEPPQKDVDLEEVGKKQDAYLTAAGFITRTGGK